MVSERFKSKKKKKKNVSVGLTPIPQYSGYCSGGPDHSTVRVTRYSV